MTTLTYNDMPLETFRVLAGLSDGETASGSYFDAVGAAYFFNVTIPGSVIVFVNPSFKPRDANFERKILGEGLVRFCVGPRGVNVSTQYTDDIVTFGDPESIALRVFIVKSFDNHPIDYLVDLKNREITYTEAWMERMRQRLGIRPKHVYK